MAKAPESESGVGVKMLSTVVKVLGSAFLIVTAIIATFIAILSLAKIYADKSDLSDSRDEYTLLAEVAKLISEVEFPSKAKAADYISEFDAVMRGTNPDYICWIKIDGTVINYPVVRGSDNDKYLKHSFSGEKNRYGALFMDYRCAGEYVPHIIIYGHNSRNDHMFGGLSKYLDSQYLAEHPIITLIINDRVVEYEISAVRLTDINDPAYFLDFSQPGSFADFAERCGVSPDAEQIVTLSTCVSRGNDNERMIVQGVLRDNSPA